MADKDGPITEQELVNEDPAQTRPPTQIILNSINPVQPGIVKEAEEMEKKKEEKK